MRSIGHRLTPALALAAVLTTSTALGWAGEIAGELRDAMERNPEASTRVIVQYRRGAGERHRALVRSRGGRLEHDLSIVRSDAYTLPAGDIAELANDPEVESVVPDRTVHAMLDYAEPTINANTAFQSGYDGRGIGVAIIDSGIMDHPDLHDASGASRVVYNQNFVPNIGNDYFDRFGHGTHVAGIVGGSAAMSNGSQYTHTFRGIAPAVKLINLRVLDRNGVGTDSAVIAAIQTAIQLKNTYNIRVINLSLGRPVAGSYTKDPLCQAVEQAWKAGIVVVVAAGNEGRNNSAGTNGYGTITAPGNDPYAITVGAMKDMKTTSRNDDQLASYSSKGPTLLDHVAKPDLVAPGNRIISSLPWGLTLTNSYPANETPDTYYIRNGDASQSPYYFTLSGTSMATPMVSGAAALLLQKTPTLTPDTVKARLMKTASKGFPASTIATDPVTHQTYTDYYDLFSVGAGYLDVWAALNNTDTLPSGANALSPTVTWNSTTHQATLVNAPKSVWNTAILWGTAIVWGTNIVSGQTAINSSAIVWGTSSTSGFAIIWGNAIVWGTGTPAGETTNVAIYGE